MYAVRTHEWGYFLRGMIFGIIIGAVLVYLGAKGMIKLPFF